MNISKKGQALNIGSLLTVGITLIVVGIALAFGLQVQGDIKSDIFTDDCSDQGGYENTTSGVCQASSTNATNIFAPTAQYNATGDAITGVSKLTGKLPTIGLVVAAVIIVGLLVSAFAFTR